MGIVQAPQHNQEVLILDEPTTGWIPWCSANFLTLVRGAAAGGGQLVAVSTVDDLLDRTRRRLRLRFVEAVPAQFV